MHVTVFKHFIIENLYASGLPEKKVAEKKREKQLCWHCWCLGKKFGPKNLNQKV
jgi:hypothetical protein